MSWDKARGPRIAFLGTGAQGASIGADFALAGLDVTFIEQWPDHVNAIRENGITVNLPSRTINAKVPALHLCQVAEIKEPFDLVFLVVKAYDTKWACQLIEPCLAPDGLIIGLQNGMTHEDIADVVGRERTIGAVIEIASNMFVPGVTNRQNDPETSWFALGALDPKTQPRVEAVAELLRNSGTVEVMEDIRSAKWMKLVVNAAELIPSAIINLPLADAARAPGMLEVMRAAGYEAMHAALADGAKIIPIIGMPPVTTNHPERYVDQIFEEVLKTFSQADTLTTSLQDWRKGRRAEVQEVNGWVVDILAAHGQQAPVNKRVMEVAYDIEAGRIEARPENSALLIETYQTVADRR
ncbi:ketopantoate reductase family protein [Neorhizobium sp. P12A]|uniref:ketopantoate reductase family protein n=1 Tax=Rhizobium/Agrobacterium group TaxID=227290 RepID=UPI0010433098|nr:MULTISPECIES: 2-dehydropantoate 2-reductase N-terminal domain-containing protein [Rhizobium/Agrobacterium group]KAA0698059.1 ketopantoate reductase family protein [Neorhizobium sp. P12A]TCR88024.1 ketopantoate reductase [Rhizobium sp. BK376]